MNPHYDEAEFPTIRPRAWSKVFADVSGPIENDMIDLLSTMLKFMPHARVDAKSALDLEFFDCLKADNVRLPNGNPLPDIFS